MLTAHKDEPADPWAELKNKIARYTDAVHQYSAEWANDERPELDMEEKKLIMSDVNPDARENQDPRKWYRSSSKCSQTTGSSC